MRKRYSNAYEHASHGLPDVLAWKLGLRKDPENDPVDATEVGEGDLPWRDVPHASRETPPAYGDLRITFIGHSTFLMEHMGRVFLTDPIFGNCQPFGLGGLRRANAPGIAFAELPPVDDVLISHSHYDHLDAPTVKLLGDRVRYWTPEGLAEWFRRRGIGSATELGWWRSAQLSSEITIHCVPAQHGSGRTPFDRNQTHWCGWVLQSATKSVYFAGDTGYSPTFRELGERFGGFDLAILPIGAYKPRWLMQPVHMDPGEAVQAHLDVRSKLSVACHWGTFRLTDETQSAPPLKLARELAARGIGPAEFQVLRAGETLDV